MYSVFSYVNFDNKSKARIKIVLNYLNLDVKSFCCQPIWMLISRAFIMAFIISSLSEDFSNFMLIQFNIFLVLLHFI
jgi:hypothetical protein